MDNLHLESIISDSIDDATLPTEPQEATSDDLPELTIEPTTTDSTETPEATEPILEATTTEVASPAKPEPTVQDDFEKKFGIPAQNASGRENRIPYTRVKKISERAASDAKTATLKEIESTHVPLAKFQELETKVKEAETFATTVGEFEQVMLNDAPRFLDYLSKMPAYAKIFGDLVAAAEAGKAQPQVQTEVKPNPSDEMPQPDQELTDGSKVYSLEGLQALNAWNRAQARKEIMGEVEKKFGPLANDYERYQLQQAALPKVQAQIADARTWPLFNESEAEIVKVLEQYPQASLERAYQHVVWPKLQAEEERLKKELETKSGEVKVNRDTIRAELLAEMKKAPRSTSVTQSTSSKPAPAGSAPRTMEEIIADSIKGLK